MHLEDVFT